MASISGSASSASYEPYACGMPSFLAASFALCASRDAIALTSLHAPFCIAGITSRTAIAAVPRTPHFTLAAFMCVSLIGALLFSITLDRFPINTFFRVISYRPCGGQDSRRQLFVCTFFLDRRAKLRSPRRTPSFVLPLRANEACLSKPNDRGCRCNPLRGADCRRRGSAIPASAGRRVASGNKEVCSPIGGRYLCR